MKKLRILVLMHSEVVPPDDVEGMPREKFEEFKTDYDVVSTLRWLGHEVHKLGVSDELAPIRAAIEELKPHVAFNLLEGLSRVVSTPTVSLDFAQR